MASKEQVKNFLKEFKVNMSIWDILFLDDRGKNSQTLADLELMPNERKKILENLVIDDYCEGPLEETQYGGSEMWVFGRTLRGKEVYIKITLGIENTSVICISFHIAEYPMEYQFK
ncbi:toxin [Winogradskyella sp. J14-2]|uniref:type II toxin-antitoxin system MqsR family toxin n=1 Tax=Winogradskyella sp. J14-2 TaxID=1936080 RepID=UPI000972978E|nr:type II toxin-antitoxin system MqsR family toxin [Winogradskyella sp. J14-2]APY07088.1 toxin [Winogradskyella sp. J14-2]